MKHRAVFRRIDPFAREEGVATRRKTRRRREAEEGVERRPVELLPGEVDEEVFMTEGERAESLRVPFEERAEREAAEAFSLALHPGPRSAH